jgi:hypothetical protein
MSERRDNMPNNSQQRQIDIILEKVVALFGKNFPEGKLRNRLLNLGLEEFVEASGTSGDFAVQRYGFPFKFNNQLDEAILVLAHFLDRFKKEGGTLEIYSLNKLSKGQEKDLSYWQDAKAKLYLELQNIILLLDGTEFDGPDTKRRSRIKRIFTFREFSDLAFLSQAGINVLGEQLAAKIEIGFIFLNKFWKTKQIRPISNSLIINFSPAKSPRERHNFYQLHEIADDSTRYDLPYKEGCHAKWYKTKETATAIPSESRLRELLGLFELEWNNLALEYSTTVSAFEQATGDFFNDAMLMMHKSYENSKVSKDLKNDQFIIDRINKTVITRDMIRLQRAMSSFDDASEIKAVDATSTKNSLNIHEASPVYRDWLRRSLNRVLKSDDVKTLYRIYILKDDEKDKDIEYQTLLRLMQYYLDYFHFEIAEMADIVHRHDPQKYSEGADASSYQKWFEDKWQTFHNRVGVYITTSSVLKKYTGKVMKKSKNYPDMFRIIFRNPPDDSDKQTGYKYSAPTYDDLTKLDYLYAKYPVNEAAEAGGAEDHQESMIYNFLNPRADTGELKFPAFTYRGNLSAANEERRLFGFANGSLGTLENLQVQNRKNILAKSLHEYMETYKDVLEEQLDKNTDEGSKAQWAAYKEIIEEIRNELNSETGNVTQEPGKLLEIRVAFEKELYEYFKPHFDYLYDVLKFQSVKVDFWADINASSILKISPFNNCEAKDTAKTGEGAVKALADMIMSEIDEQLKHPERIPQPSDYGIETPAPADSKPAQDDPFTGGAMTNPTTYSKDVFISYRWVSPDQEWVRDQLYQRLVEAGLKVALDVEDFVPGRNLILEMERAGEESRHVLCIISPEYFEKGRMVEFESLLARLRDPGGRNSTLIPLILRQADIPNRIRDLIPIDWTVQKNLPREWKKLLRVLGAQNLDVTPPGIP